MSSHEASAETDKERDSAFRIFCAIAIASRKERSDAKRWVMRAREPDGALNEAEATIVMQHLGLRGA